MGSLKNINKITGSDVLSLFEKDNANGNFVISARNGLNGNASHK